MLPKAPRHAFEFRHSSWWEQETADLLKSYGCAFVAINHRDYPDTIFPNTDFLYVRFHGLGPQKYLYDYFEQELKHWTTRLSPLLKGRALYAFFNNDIQVNAIANAHRFVDLLGRGAGTDGKRKKGAQIQGLSPEIPSQGASNLAQFRS